ncbi:MAG: DUF3179 domain-containing (seleno)protein [Planctomycetota bacterium]|jgi:hypothetical protein
MASTEDALGCSETAASRLAVHEPKIAANFEISLHIGKLIAAWDNPEFVAAAKATHMRDDDYVVGIEYKEHFRAYPLWITDNYHMINDQIAGEPILFSTCERCQSGSAFMSRVGGQAAKFSAMGMYNASLTMVNRRPGRGIRRSLWLHYEGVAIDGPEKGNFLDQIPSYHMTWKEWASAHPQTDVMLAPDDPHHRDARHGHGREEYFSRPGMDPPLAKTITGCFDHRYPENEMVLGININAGIRAYPLLEIKRQGGLLNDELGGQPILIVAGPRPEQITMSALSRIVGDRTLTFALDREEIRDRETSSAWTIEGAAIAGPLEGQRLLPLRWQYVRWHAWVYPHPSTELFICSRPLPRYPDFPSFRQAKTLGPVLERLAALDPELLFSHVIFELSLPHEARAGICVHSGSDRLNLFEFESPAAAKDYVDLQGAWFCMPFDARIARKRAVCSGPFVIESDPVDQYAEPTQTVHYPDNETAWSRLVQSGGGFDSGEPAEGHFMSAIRFLEKKGYDVVECAFLPHSQRRVGTISAIAATIESDRFAVYRCVDEEAAEATVAEVNHAICAGSWVLRSIPVLMYADPHYEMGQLADNEIGWSPLLQNEAFRRALAEYAEPAS